jgi:hypothetical protein
MKPRPELSACLKITQDKRFVSILSSHRDDDGCPGSLAPTGNILVSHDVGAMKAGSRPIDDLLSHDLHAAAASGSTEFWFRVGYVRSFGDRNRAIGPGVG